MNWLWALLIVVMGNVALYAGLLVLLRVVSAVCRRR
ncbi:MAG: hypothetical protein H6Q33_3981 [Deltaproteobacteria bacterium]|jgi:hypothetical protein|nr:hypothetical protein [Deltaproteobacteria bacterium]